MKKNNLVILAASIVFSILFFEQNAGLNFLLFSLMTGGLIVLFNRNELDKKWYLFLLLNLCAAWNIVNINSDLSIVAWFFSTVVLLGKSRTMENSYIFSMFSAGISPVASIPKLFVRPPGEDQVKKKISPLIYLAAFAVALIFVAIFFGLYKEANPLFDQFTANIDFSWINIPFIFVTVFGFVILFTATHIYRNKILGDWDRRQIAKENSTRETSPQLGGFISITSILLFVGLNIMLLTLNGLDIKYIYIIDMLPKEINLTDFLHTSVASIVFSILIAIILILLIRMLSIKNKAVNLLIYAWIGQSFIMVFHTFLRNADHIIRSHQLTHQRIGVYVFLSLAVFGLCYTLYTLLKNKSNWLLVDLNVRTWFLVLVISSFCNWDAIITEYNLEKNPKEIDMTYLVRLSGNNTAQMIAYYRKHPEIFSPNYSPYYTHELKEELLEKERCMIREGKQMTWQSFNFSRKRQYELLKQLKK